MEFRLLEYFLAVAREQNITAAAESLHISQPALSTQLKALEAELGKQLLIRGTKGSRKVTLTEEGMLLRKRAEEMVALMRRTREEIMDDAIAGSVFIGTGETEMVRLFARAAKRIAQEHPDICYHITSGNAEHVLETLDKGLIDFGLLFTPIDPHKYEAMPIPLEDRWGVLMRADSPLAHKDAIAPQDLWDKPLILPSQKADQAPLERWLLRPRDELHVVASYNLMFNASLLVDEGLGYALGFDGIINTAGSNFCFRPLTPALHARALIVWKRYQLFSRAARAFLACLRAMLEEE